MGLRMKVIWMFRCREDAGKGGWLEVGKRHGEERNGELRGLPRIDLDSGY